MPKDEALSMNGTHMKHAPYIDVYVDQYDGMAVSDIPGHQVAIATHNIAMMIVLLLGDSRSSAIVIKFCLATKATAITQASINTGGNSEKHD